MSALAAEACPAIRAPDARPRAPPPCAACAFYKPESKQCARVFASLTMERGGVFASASAVVGTRWCKPSWEARAGDGPLSFPTSDEHWR